MYESENTIDICLDSITAQQCNDYEILVINDGSTDRSGEIVRDRARSDIRIRYFEQNNAGQSVARNLGIEQARGNYLLFIDSDDYIATGTLSFLKQALKAHGYPDVVAYRSKRRGSSGLSITSAKGPIVFRDVHFPQGRELFFNKGFTFSGSLHTKVYKRELIESCGIRFDRDLRKGQDAVFNLAFFSHVSIALQCDRVNYYYMYNPEGTVRQYYHDKLGLYKKHYIAENVFYQDWGLLEQYRLERHSSFLTMAYDSILNEFHENSTTPFRSIPRQLAHIGSDNMVREAIEFCSRSKFKLSSWYLKVVFKLVSRRRYWTVMVIILVRESFRRPR